MAAFEQEKALADVIVALREGVVIGSIHKDAATIEDATADIPCDGKSVESLSDDEGEPVFFLNNDTDKGGKV